MPTEAEKIAALNTARAKCIAKLNHEKALLQWLGTCTPDDFSEYKKMYWYGGLEEYYKSHGTDTTEFLTLEEYKSDLADMISSTEKIVALLTLEDRADEKRVSLRAYIFLFMSNKMRMEAEKLQRQSLVGILKGKIPGFVKLLTRDGMDLRTFVDRWFDAMTPCIGVYQDIIDLIRTMTDDDDFRINLEEYFLNLLSVEGRSISQRVIDTLLISIGAVVDDYKKLSLELRKLNIPVGETNDQADRACKTYDKMMVWRRAFLEKPESAASSATGHTNPLGDFDFGFELHYYLLNNRVKLKESNRLLRRKIKEHHAQEAQRLKETVPVPVPQVQEQVTTPDELEATQTQDSGSATSPPAKTFIELQKEIEAEIATENAAASVKRALERAKLQTSPSTTLSTTTTVLTSSTPAVTVAPKFIFPAKYNTSHEEILARVFRAEHDSLTVANLEHLISGLGGETSYKKGSGVMFALNKKYISCQEPIKTKFGLDRPHAPGKAKGFFGSYMKEFKEFLEQAGVPDPNLVPTVRRVAAVRNR